MVIWSSWCDLEERSRFVMMVGDASTTTYYYDGLVFRSYDEEGSFDYDNEN